MTVARGTPATAPAPGDDFTVGDIYRCLLEMDRASLTLAERRLMHELLCRPGPARQAELIDALHGDDPDGGPTERVIDAHVHHLRAKLVRSGFAIETHWGQGYRVAKVRA